MQFLRSLLARFSRFIRRYAWASDPGNRLSRQSLMPLAAVLPIVIYAYSVQAIVTSHTERHERDVALTDVKSLSDRLDRSLKADLTSCLDYAHWGEAYQQVVTRDSDWLKTNISEGVAAFGFDTVVLQAASGDVVYAKGATSAMLRDIERYGLLRRCLNREEGTGILSLDGHACTYAAGSVLTSERTGPSRGMLLLARPMNPAFLAAIAPGTQHRVTLCQADGMVVGAANLGPLDKLPGTVSDIVAGGAAPSHTAVADSTDGTVSYGVLEVNDPLGRRVGALVDVRSRARVMATLRTIRQMSVSLMVLCAVIGVAGVSYFRNRALALRANRDELTGLFNHGYLREYLKNQVQLAGRYNRSLAIVMIDIDHFKYVNDSHGHATGDAVLKVLAEIVVETLRATDVAARYGGEEFAVVLPETDLLQAIAGAERLRAMVQKRAVRARTSGHTTVPAAELNFTVSIGVASCPEDGQTAADLVQAADAALSEAKRTRNAVSAYQDIAKAEHAGSARFPTLDGFLRDSSISTVRPLVTAIDTRDPGSVRHSEKTAEYAVAIGSELGFSTLDLALACKAAFLHDVGMIGVPDHLLTKATRLTEEEMASIKRHPKLGADILSQSPQLAAVAKIVLCHHEHYDGTGYPDRQAGEDIPIIARVITVADALDAMVSPRSYKAVLSLDQALSELSMQSGKQFDPNVVHAARQVIGHLLEEQEREAA